jgi:hypothetical protein
MQPQKRPLTSGLSGGRLERLRGSYSSETALPGFTKALSENLQDKISRQELALMVSDDAGDDLFIQRGLFGCHERADRKNAQGV